MTQYGTWSPYVGSEAVILVVILLGIAAVLAYWGTRLQRPLEARRPGNFVAVSLALIWFLSWFAFLVAARVYMQSLVQQVGKFTVPKNPISPITAICGLATFVATAVLTRRSGFKLALGSAFYGLIAAPMIFELPFDLIVFGRNILQYPPCNSPCSTSCHCSWCRSQAIAF